jgi:hypothetical protein
MSDRMTLGTLALPREVPGTGDLIFTDEGFFMVSEPQGDKLRVSPLVSRAEGKVDIERDARKFKSINRGDVKAIFKRLG